MNEIFGKHTKEALVPDFEHKCRVHDWRNHVPEEILQIWNDLSIDERCVIIYMAEAGADAEEWD